MMKSKRFHKQIYVTHHAAERMKERNITETMLLDIIENGEIKHKDIKRLWIYKEFSERSDNLICAAVVSEDMLVVKTVMINWQLME
ncbi:MAG: DUF4258 domain-containing protein [Desulfococcaceae bacterium]